VHLAEASVRYFLSDPVNHGCPCDTGCVTLGLGTMMDAHEVLLFATGPLKRAPLRRVLEGAATRPRALRCLGRVGMLGHAAVNAESASIYGSHGEAA